MSYIGHFMSTQTYRLSLCIFGLSSTLMICSTIPNFNLLDNQNAVCYYGQVKKNKKTNVSRLYFCRKESVQELFYNWQLKVFFTNYNPRPGIARVFS